MSSTAIYTLNTPGVYLKATRVASIPESSWNVEEDATPLSLVTTDGGTGTVSWSAAANAESQYMLNDNQRFVHSMAGNKTGTVTDLTVTGLRVSVDQGTVLTPLGQQASAPATTTTQPQMINWHAQYFNGDQVAPGYRGVQAVDSMGNTYCVGRYGVLKCDPSLTPISQIGSVAAGTTGAPAGQFNNASQLMIGVDASDNVYTLEPANKRITKFDNTGAYVAMYTGTWDNPWSLAVDQVNSRIYVVDRTASGSANNTVYQYSNTFAVLTSWVSPSATTVAADGGWIVTNGYNGSFYGQMYDVTGNRTTGWISNATLANTLINLNVSAWAVDYLNNRVYAYVFDTGYFDSGNSYVQSSNYVVSFQLSGAVIGVIPIVWPGIKGQGAPQKLTRSKKSGLLYYSDNAIYDNGGYGGLGFSDFNQLSGVLYYYLALGIGPGAAVPGFNYLATLDPTITCTEWTGAVWDYIKQVVSAKNVEIAIPGDTFTVRDIGTTVLTLENFVGQPEVSYAQSQTPGQQVTVTANHYAPITTRIIYDAYADSNNVLSADVGEISTTTINTPSYITSVKSPKVANSYLTAGAGYYSVSGNDNLPVVAQQWTDYGGRVTAQVNKDDPTSIDVTIYAPRSGIPGVAAPYKLAVSDGTNDYAQLNLIGSGMSRAPKDHTVWTGADPVLVPQVVATTIQNVAMNNRADIFDGIYNTIDDVTGPVATLTATVPIDNFVVFGSGPGCRFRYGNCLWRITNVTYNHGSVDITATRFTTIAEFDARHVNDTFTTVDSLMQSNGGTYDDSTMTPLRTTTTNSYFID